MRAVFRWLVWMGATLMGAAIALPLGLATAVALSALFSAALFFLWVIGAFIGLAIGATLGGAVTGAMVGLTQRPLLVGRLGELDGWVRRSALVYGAMGLLSVAGFIPIMAGDISLVVLLASVGAVIASGVQWYALRGRLAHAWWWMGSGAAATIVAIFGVGAAIGSLTGRGGVPTLQNAFVSHETLREVKGVQIVSHLGRLLFFVSFEDAYQTKRWELWTSDGTEAGTTLVQPVYTGWNEPMFIPLSPLPSGFYFRNFGVEEKEDAQSYLNGMKAWRTDGTTPGTYPLLALDEDLEHLVEVDGTLFFLKQQQQKGCALFRSDGTDAGTTLVRPLEGVCDRLIAAQGKRLMFVTRVDGADAATHLLWRSDGTAQNTAIIARLTVQPGVGGFGDLVPFRDQFALFVHGNDNKLSTLWISDGTEAGTKAISEIPGNFYVSGSGAILQVVDDRLLLTPLYNQAASTSPCGVWSSDGSVAGTQRVSDVCINYDETARLRMALLFFLEGPNRTWNLWASDGTAAGTHAVREGFTNGSGSAGLRPRFLLVEPDAAYFAVEDQAGCAVWRSDGSRAGTRQLWRGCPEQIADVGGTLFFLRQVDERAVELWRSDGSEANTTVVRRIP